MHECREGRGHHWEPVHVVRGDGVHFCPTHRMRCSWCGMERAAMAGDKECLAWG